MYADKVIGYFDIHVQYQFKYYTDLDVFLWTVGQTVAILLLVFAFFFKPYRWSLISPLVVFSMQFMYVWSDEGWIQHEYYFLYTGVFVATILGTVYFVKYMIAKIGSVLQTSRNKDVNTLINFVVEVQNEHLARILKSANALELLHEFKCSDEEKELLRKMLKRELQTSNKQFEVRVIETFHKLDD